MFKTSIDSGVYCWCIKSSLCTLLLENFEFPGAVKFKSRFCDLLFVVNFYLLLWIIKSSIHSKKKFVLFALFFRFDFFLLFTFFDWRRAHRVLGEIYHPIFFIKENSTKLKIKKPASSTILKTQISKTRQHMRSKIAKKLHRQKLIKM